MCEKQKDTFSELVEVIEKLRKQCPWDSVQTHESLKYFLRSETEEVVEGIDILSSCGSGENLCEELGDLLMLIILNSIIAEEEGLFTIEDVIAGVSAKMKYRHPKIFSPEDQEAVQLTWDELKIREKSLRKKQEKSMEKLDKNSYCEWSGQ